MKVADINIKKLSKKIDNYIHYQGEEGYNYRATLDNKSFIETSFFFLEDFLS